MPQVGAGPGGGPGGGIGGGCRRALDSSITTPPPSVTTAGCTVGMAAGVERMAIVAAGSGDVAMTATLTGAVGFTTAAAAGVGIPLRAAPLVPSDVHAVSISSAAMPLMTSRGRRRELQPERRVSRADIE